MDDLAVVGMSKAVSSCPRKLLNDISFRLSSNHFGSDDDEVVSRNKFSGLGGAPISKNMC